MTSSHSADSRRLAGENNWEAHTPLRGHSHGITVEFSTTGRPNLPICMDFGNGELRTEHDDNDFERKWLHWCPLLCMMNTLLLGGDSSFLHSSFRLRAQIRIKTEEQSVRLCY